MKKIVALFSLIGCIMGIISACDSYEDVDNGIGKVCGLDETCFTPSPGGTPAPAPGTNPPPPPVPPNHP